MSPMTMCVADGGGGGSTVPTDGGLINPALLPAKAADLDTTAITGAADDVRTMGSTVDTQTDEIKTTWSGLSSYYLAPEQAQVYALMNDPATASQKLKDTFDKMAGYLDTYAEALDVIKPQLADFEKRAQAFRDEVKDGVWVDATEAADAGFGTYVTAAWNGLTSQPQERKKVPWDQDTETWEKNEAFVKEIGGIYADVSAAAAACATSINGLTSLPDEEKKVEGIPEESFYNPEAPMPWGSPGDEDRNCAESVGHGAYQFGKGTVEGLGQLISYNPQTGEWGDWENAGQAWLGTGNVLLSLVVTANPMVQWYNASLKLTGQGDNAVSKWIDERNQVSATVATSLVGIDLNAEDPFHKWKKDGVATFTESFLNVGTMFIPGAGQAGAAVKVAGLGSKLARLTGTVADFAVPGGSWMVKGGLHTIPVLKNVFKFTDEIPVTMLDDVTKVGGKTPTLNAAAALDDMVPTTKPGTASTTQVSNTYFGDRSVPAAVRPDIETPDGAAARPRSQQPDTQEPQTPKPEAGSPKPESGTPKPEAETPKPEAGSPKPESGTPKPEAETPKPESGTPKPESGTPKPETETPKPDSENPKPEAETPNPEAEAPRPETEPARTEPSQPVDSDGAHHGPATDEARHQPADPPGTQRDVDGVLRDEKGRFAAPERADVPVEKATKGDSESFAMDSPAAQADQAALLDKQQQAVQATREASLDLQQGARQAGVPLDALQKSKRDVTKTLNSWVKSGRIDEATGQRLADLASESRAKALALKKASEALGDHATAVLVEQRGQISLIADTGASSGRFDHVAVGMDGDKPYLTIYESKGGGSPLGTRLVDGVERQQGTAAYANSVAAVDPRLAESIQAFIAKYPDSPITQALKTGDIPVRYELVRARITGSTTVTPFVLDAKIKLPGTGG